jgi:hypothetical protein
MSVFPQNFDLLAGGEDKIRALSKAAIEASEDLSLHARMIERAMNMLDYMSKRCPHSGEDELVLQMLAARLFNSGASAMKLLMGGYYQSTVMVLRDIFETTFLLDYFHGNRDQIAVWRNCDEKKRNREFGAMKIRIAPDDRDGFTERKREAAYNLLCQLGTHPTYHRLPDVAGEGLQPDHRRPLLRASLTRRDAVGVRQDHHAARISGPPCQGAKHRGLPYLAGLPDDASRLVGPLLRHQDGPRQGRRDPGHGRRNGAAQRPLITSRTSLDDAQVHRSRLFMTGKIDRVVAVGIGQRKFLPVQPRRATITPTPDPCQESSDRPKRSAPVASNTRSFYRQSGECIARKGHSLPG